MEIGIVGAGFIGGTLARKLANVGHKVRLANSKTPSTLSAFRGVPNLMPMWAVDAMTDADIVIFSVPASAMTAIGRQLVPRLGSDSIVLDTGNYYPNRDGRIDALDQGTPDSVWTSEILQHPVFKVFNNIGAPSLQDKGTDDPRQWVGLSVAGTDGQHKTTVFGLVEQLGFEPVDGGTLDQSWRQQPGTPSYCRDLSAPDLRRCLAETVESEIGSYHQKRDEMTSADFDAAARRQAAKMKQTTS